MASLDAKMEREDQEEQEIEEKKICVNVRDEKFFLSKHEATQIPVIAAWMERWKAGMTDEYVLDANPEEFRKILKKLRGMPPENLEDFLGLTSEYQQVDSKFQVFCVRETESKLIFPKIRSIKNCVEGTYYFAIETAGNYHRGEMKLDRKAGKLTFSVEGYNTEISVEKSSLILERLETYRKLITPLLVFDEIFPQK